MVNVPVAAGTGPPEALAIFDRSLGLSANGTARDSGMLAYLGINGGTLPLAPAFAAAVANGDTYNAVVSGKTVTVSDPARGVIANDINVFGVKVVGAAPAGLTLNLDGTFTYTAGVPTSFTYCGNGPRVVQFERGNHVEHQATWSTRVLQRRGRISAHDRVVARASTGGWQREHG